MAAKVTVVGVGMVGEEIISILENLNKKGKTIIMVSHEKELAARAKRTIRMRDGEIVSDERIAEEPGGTFSHPGGISIDDTLSESHSSSPPHI